MDTKKKVKEMQAQEEQREKTAESKWQERTENKLSTLQRDYGNEIEHLEKKSKVDFQSKEQLALLELKNALLAEAKNQLIECLSTQIKEYYSDYIEFLIKEFGAQLGNIGQDSILSLNERDRNYFKTKSFPKLPHHISICDKPLEGIGGFELSAADDTITVDYRLESLLQKYENVLLLEFNRLIPNLSNK